MNIFFMKNRMNGPFLEDKDRLNSRSKCTAPNNITTRKVLENKSVLKQNKNIPRSQVAKAIYNSNTL